MKKMITLSAVVLTAMLFTSCKKDYTCTCVTKDNGVELSRTSVTIKDTKKNAESACSGKATASGGGVTITTSCSL